MAAYSARVNLPRRIVRLAACAAAFALGACASEPPPEGVASTGAAPAEASFVVPAGGYASAFQTVKDTLRDAGFVLARVDAREGVIVTAPRESSGIATPWLGAEATFADGVEATANVERRVVEVRFGPALEAPGTGEPRAQGWEAAEVVGAVTASVWRVRSPGRRVESSSIRLTSFASDSSVRARGLEPDFTTRQRADEALATRCAGAIRDRVGDTSHPSAAPQDQ